MLAAARRIFFNLRNTMAGSDHSIIDEVEAGEVHIKGKIEAVLVGDELIRPSNKWSPRSMRLSRPTHDQMRDIKHSLHAQPAT